MGCGKCRKNNHNEDALDLVIQDHVQGNIIRVAFIEKHFR